MPPVPDVILPLSVRSYVLLAATRFTPLPAVTTTPPCAPDAVMTPAALLEKAPPAFNVIVPAVAVDVTAPLMFIAWPLKFVVVE